MGGFIGKLLFIIGYQNTRRAEDDVIELQESSQDGVDIVRRCRNGIPHCIDGPAESHYVGDIRIYDCWYYNGKKHRVNGPAEICYKNFEITREIWFYDGKRHRDGGPAEIVYERNGRFGTWYRNGKQHRDDGPAKIWYIDGQIALECWYRDGNYHREDGPADIRYENGQKTREMWYRDDYLYKTGTLACVIYKDINSKSEYLFDGKLTKNIDEFRDAVRGDAIHDALRPLPIPISKEIAEYYCYQ